MVKIKGVNLSSGLKSNEARFGKESLKRLLDSLSDEDKKVFASTILDSAWYPLDVFVHYIEKSFEQNYKGNVEEYKKTVHDATELQLKGVYRSFLALGTVEKIVHELGRITHQYFQGITVKTEELAEGKVRVIYEGFEKQHAFYEISVQAWWEKVLGMLGIAKDIKVQIITSIGAGKGILELLLTWNKK